MEELSHPLLWLLSHHSGLLPFTSQGSLAPGLVLTQRLCLILIRTFGVAALRDEVNVLLRRSGLQWCRVSCPLLSPPGISFQRLVRTEQGLPVKNYQSSTV